MKRGRPKVDTGGLPYNQWYNQNKRLPRLRRKNAKDKCIFCTILLTSKFAGKGRRSYCEGCLEYPQVKKELWRTYTNRANYKKSGKSVKTRLQKSPFVLKTFKQTDYAQAYKHLESLGV